MAPKFSTRALLAFTFLILILSPVVANLTYQSQLKPASRTESYQIFVIRPGQPVDQIAQNLKEAGLVRNALAFRLLVAQMGIGKSIQAGDFRLSPHSSAGDIATELTHGAIDVWITFPEGTRVEEMVEIIEAKLKTPGNDKYQFDNEEFIELAREGYMFPDTYLIPKDTTAQLVADRMHQTFSQKVDQNLLVSKKLTADEIITLASLIEREAKTNEERPTIAGILLNRLSAGIALQVDATVQYAKGYDAASDSWWPQVVPEDYQSVISPFNTYLHAGLPPGPIANPGIESIRAARSPQETDYLYYLHDSEGKIHYAENIEEHHANIRKYL
ncbi:MAG: endolytic transglycosylase MltG [Patescibacteria group bacterium]